MTEAVAEPQRTTFNARRCFVQTLAVIVLLNLARGLGVAHPPLLFLSLFTVALAVIAWRSHATLRDLGLGAGEAMAGLRYGGAAFGLVLAGLVIGAVLPVTNEFLHDSRAEIAGGHLLYELLVPITLFTVIPEELAFRGNLLGSAVRLWGPWPGSVVSSAIFGLWHIVPSLHTISGNRAVAGASSSVLGEALLVLGAVVVTFTAGLAFCWLRLRSGSLLAPVLAHVATNGLALLVAWAVIHWF